MIVSPREKRLLLPQVTACAVASVNVMATLRALQVSVEQVKFAQCLFFTDANVRFAHPEIQVVTISKVSSSAQYSEFILTKLVDYVHTSHCLVTQWDGHILNAARWVPEFLEYDYIGASWPQFDDGRDVGNGGFSLRTKRLMEACRAPRFHAFHPEDLAIARANRTFLEEIGMRFAPRDLADRFSAERRGDVRGTFGYHGAFNMPQAIGVEPFWSVYRELDDLGTVRHDFTSILSEVSKGAGGVRRVGKMLLDRLSYAFRSRQSGRHKLGA